MQTMERRVEHLQLTNDQLQVERKFSSMNISLFFSSFRIGSMKNKDNFHLHEDQINIQQHFSLFFSKSFLENLRKLNLNSIGLKNE